MKQLLLLSLLLLGSLRLQAGTLYLNDGSILKGDIIILNDRGVVIETTASQFVKREDIKAIDFKGEGLPASIPAPGIAKDTKRNKPDSWYMSLLIGGSESEFHQDLKPFNQWETHGGFYTSLGFYGTLSEKFLLGGALTLHGTVFKGEQSTSQGHEWKGMTAAYTHLDMKYFFKHIGRGFFLEGGLGAAHVSFLKSWSDHDDKDVNNHRMQFGFGLNWGVGYAFELSRYESALLIGLGGMYLYAPIQADKHKDTYAREDWSLSASQFYIGLLW